MVKKQNKKTGGHYAYKVENRAHKINKLLEVNRKTPDWIMHSLWRSGKCTTYTLDE